MSSTQTCIDVLCDLAANPKTTREVISRFITDKKPEVNAPDSKSKLSAVYHAGRSGNLIVLQYLIEDMHANLNAENRDDNLFNFVMDNPLLEVRQYVSDLAQKIWEHYELP